MAICSGKLGLAGCLLNLGDISVKCLGPDALMYADQQ